MTTLLARLVAAGTPADLVGEVALLIAKAQLLEERKANDRERKERQRSREVTGQPGQDVTSASRAEARAETPTKNSSSTHSENNKEKQESTASALPRLVACLMPDDFEPAPELVEKAVREWGYTRAQVFEKRDALHDWSHGKNQKRTKWNSVLSGALRSDRPRPSTGPPRPSSGGWGGVLQRLNQDDDEQSFGSSTIEGIGALVAPGTSAH